MIVLPIVARELLVASRRRGTYWLRVLAAGLALIFGGITLVSLAVAPAFTGAGGQLFAFLSWVGLVFALLIGVNATADCLSREKREGTLGLLFLTDLKGFDVVFGKLAAAALTVFYGIVAMLPVLALPLILGGVTSGEYARMTLVWLNSLFFSVAAGMAVSAWTREEAATFGNAFAVVLGVTLAVPLAGMLLAQQTGMPSLSAPFAVLSPVTACLLAFEASYVTQRTGYWTSLGLTHALSWLCLGLACRAARGHWRDQTASARTSLKSRRRRPQRTPPDVAFRRHSLQRNPVFWLLSRERGVRHYPWVLLISMVGIWLWGFWLERDVFSLEATVAIGFLTHFLFKWWVTTVACRSLANERENGSMELLLSTPVTVPEILRGAGLAARRLFGWPVAGLAGLQFLLLGLAWHWPRTHGNSPAMAFLVCANIVIFLADCWALHWAGMLAGFTSRQPQVAVWKTLLTVLALPWLGVWAVLAMALLTRGFPEKVTFPVAWVFFSVVADLFFGLRARRRLRHGLRTVALWGPAEREVAG